MHQLIDKLTPKQPNSMKYRGPVYNNCVKKDKNFNVFAKQVLSA